MPKARSFKDRMGDTWYEMSDSPSHYTMTKTTARPGKSGGHVGFTETTLSDRWGTLHSYKLREIGPKSKPATVKVLLTQSEIDLLDELLYRHVGHTLAVAAGSDKFAALASEDFSKARINSAEYGGFPTLEEDS
jgi:hypothetical protein